MERSEVEAAPAFIVREYRDDDLQAVTRLWRESFPDDVERKEQHVTMIAKRAHSEGLLLVADQGGAIIGSVIAPCTEAGGKYHQPAPKAPEKNVKNNNKIFIF